MISFFEHATAALAAAFPTIDLRRFKETRTLQHPAIRQFASEAFDDGAVLVYLASPVAIVLVTREGEVYGYQDARDRLRAHAPILGVVAMTMADEAVDDGECFGAALRDGALSFRLSPLAVGA